jgi:beta-aspartyl-peptidase (threonine type)
MKKLIVALLLVSSGAYAQIAIAIHGGAGTITRKNMSPAMEKAYREGLEKALKKGYSILEKGGTSLDAVEAAVMEMENNPLFNAAKGAVFTHEGKNELDAAIMSGKDLKAGAIAGVTTLKNPIRTARKVMENSQHVMLVGKGAEEFAKLQGEEIVDPSYFYTETRWNGLQRALKAEKVQLDHTDSTKKEEPRRTGSLIFDEGKKYGTVGAVALDKDGNLAAATSTGGMTNKRWNRIGDAPIIGAGTYANNATCAISATGHGEYFIRSVVAYDISALMEYKGLSLKDASEEVVMKKLVERGGEGGIIAVDKNGNVSLPFNSEGMYRASIDKTGKVYIGIFKDDTD